jgi:predicted ribosome quality control (RQC) complex YloA/Tae2 family protein
MELSGIEIRYLVNEAKSKIILGYYVSSINAVTKDSFLFKLHHSTEPDIILMVSVKGIWITKLKFKPVEENEQVNTIKAEVERSKIESIDQIGSERIVTLKFRHLDGNLRIMIAEFFGEGNIILCDENMQILSIINSIEVRHRTLKVGLRYTSPPSRGIDVFELSIEQLKTTIKDEAQDLDVLRWMGRNLSMPKKFVEEIATRARIQSRKVGQLSEEDVTRIYVAVKELVTDVSSGRNHEPIVILGDDGKALDALPIVTNNARKLRVRKVNSYLDAVDEVLSNNIMTIDSNIRTIEIDRQVALLEHDLSELNKAKEAVISKATAIRKIANELMELSYLGIYDYVDDSVKGMLQTNSADIVNERGIKYLEVVGERIHLNSNLPKVSSMLYERAKEMERGNTSIEENKRGLLDQIERLRNRSSAIQKKIVIKQLASREWYERYRWFITGDGLLAIGGRDASSNSAIIRKHLTEYDIVFHAEVYGSPFFIIKNAIKVSEMETTLQEVAQATVSFSRAWKDGLSSADAYWVMPDQIKKGAPTGQYLPKGSFVIEGKRNYIKGSEIKLAVGIMHLSDRYLLVCGPVGAIRKKSLVFSMLLPGGLDPMNAAKKIKSELVRVATAADTHRDDNYSLTDFIKNTSLDDFIRTIPSGRAKINFTGRGEGEKVLLTNIRPALADEQST